MAMISRRGRPKLACTTLAELAASAAVPAAKRRKKSSGRGAKKTKTPKSYLDKVVFAIRELKSSSGSSRAAIAKFLKQRFAVENKNALKKALKAGETSGVLLRDKQSFRVAGDAAYAADPAFVVDAVDTRVGDGAEAVEGSDVTVGYKGKLESFDGMVFDSASKFTFTLGAGDVIKGWDRGILGMRVGGVRTLVVPPKMGYGQKGSGGKSDPLRIPPGATLYFVVTLRAVR